MLVSEVIKHVRDHCRGLSPDGTPIDERTTRDKVLYGNGRVDEECTGVVCCIWASSDVIRAAHDLGANLIISHEALFWNHGDRTDWLEKQHNSTFARKRTLLDDAGAVVWRCHDYIHSGIPDVEGNWVDGIFWGLARELGWTPVRPIAPLADSGVLVETELEGRPASELARTIAHRLHLNGTRVIGDPSTPVRRAAVAMHLGSGVDEELIRAMDDRIDCLLAMETTDYTVLQYVRDASQTGTPKCVIACGHFNLEEPGMSAMADWLPDALGHDAPPVSFVGASDPYHYI